MWHISWVWPTTIDRQTSNVTYSSAIAHRYTALLTLPNCNMPPMEADSAYQGCPTSCKLHSRSIAVGRIGTCDLEIAHTCYTISRLRTRATQSPDCAHVLHNLEIVHTCYAISGFWECATQSQEFSDCAKRIHISPNSVVCCTSHSLSVEKWVVGVQHHLQQFRIQWDDNPLQ